MPTKLACADFTFPLLSHDHSLDLVSRIGVQGVDIGLFEGRSHLHPSVELESSEQNGSRLAAKVADRGLQVADVFLQMDEDFTVSAINHPEASRRAKAQDWFQRTLTYAVSAGCRHVTALPGVYFDNESPQQSLGRCHHELAWRVEQARGAGIVFGIEAHVGSIVPSPPEALQLIEAVPGLTLTLDYTHFTSRGTPDSEIEPLLPHASHFHVRGAREGRLQASFKENVIDYCHVVELMKANGYKGYLGIEYVWIDWEHCNEVDNLSETILFRDFLRSLDNSS